MKLYVCGTFLFWIVFIEWMEILQKRCGVYYKGFLSITRSTRRNCGKRLRKLYQAILFYNACFNQYSRYGSDTYTEGKRSMNTKILVLGALLTTNLVTAMEQTKEFSLVTEASQNDVVRLLLTDSQSSGNMHEVAIPIHLAKLIGAISDLLENHELKEAGFPLPRVTLDQWSFIQRQLERAYGVVHNVVNVAQLRKEIIDEYEKVDAQCLIEHIQALDYMDIPLLLELACDVVKKSDFAKFNFEQINLLPGGIGNSVILQKLVRAYGPMPLREIAVCKGHEAKVTSLCVTNDGKVVSGSEDKTVRVWDMMGYEIAVCIGHERGVSSVCVTSDGKIVSGSDDKTIRVWDMKGNDPTQLAGPISGLGPDWSSVGPLPPALIDRPGTLLLEAALRPLLEGEGPSPDVASSPFGQALILLIRLLGDMHRDHLKLVREELEQIRRINLEMKTTGAGLARPDPGTSTKAATVGDAAANGDPEPGPGAPHPPSWTLRPFTAWWGSASSPGSRRGGAAGRG